MSIIMLCINNARYLLVYFFTLIRITINELQISWWTYDINFPHTFYFNCKKKEKINFVAGFLSMWPGASFHSGRDSVFPLQ
jgi:hypothetical protein